MVDNTASAMAEIHCWVMTPSGNSVTGYVFDWSWSQWTYAGRIIAGRCVTRAGSMGDASFRLLRKNRSEPWNNTAFNTTGAQGIIPGAYVCITSGDIGDVQPVVAGDTSPNPKRELDPAKVLWYGWIASIDQEVIAETTDGLGSVRALEMGHLLDRQQVVGWARKKADSAYPEALNSPPTANIAGPGQVILGNAIAGTSDLGASVYLFARLPADCGTATTNYFTRWRLLRHLIKVCTAGRNLPAIKLVCLDQGIASIAAGTELADPTTAADSATAYYLNRTETPEVFNLEEPTFKGQLDLLIPKSRGLGWRLDVQKTFWVIVPYTIDDVGNYEIPVNSTVADLSLVDEPIKSVHLREHADDMPDRVTVEGSRIVWCGTVSKGDANLEQGWTATQLSDYKAAGAITDTAAQKTKNRALRQAPGLRDVFTRFILKHSAGGGSSTNGDLSVCSVPGVSNGGDRAFCPELTLEALLPAVGVHSSTVLVRVQPGLSRSPYLPTAKILRNIPWPEGLKSDGTDMRDATALACPQYMQPQIFRFDSSLYGSTYLWRHLNADNGSTDSLSYPVSFDVDESGPVMRITATPPEHFAKGTGDWTSANPADIDPTTNTKSIDWRDLVVTLAIESDQRVGFTVDRVANINPRRTLVVRDDSLHCWAIHKNTILGLTNNASETGVDRVSVTNANNAQATSQGLAYLTRNDFPLAVKRARQIAAFAFRKRNAITIVRARPDEQPTWAYIGRMLNDVIEGYDDASASLGTHTVRTVIEEISRDFSGSMVISTDMPTLPTFGGGSGSSSASSGGAVSCTGGGTVAQSLLQTNTKVNDLDRGTARVPVIPSKGGGASAVTFSVVKITGGNTLATGQAGIKYSSSAITTVPSDYNPDVDTAFIDGIGRGDLYIDGTLQSGKVMVVLDTSSAINFALLGNDVAYAVTTKSMTGGTRSYYIPGWV